jgi:hypothetical protein
MISPDAENYLSMVENEYAYLPFSRRLLVPFIASLIPLEPEASLAFLTYSSLSIFYFVAFLLVNRLGLPLITQILAIVVIFFSTGHLLLYQNPHIVDAFCHMCAAFMLLYLLKSKAIKYGSSALAGVLAHEMALFTVPSFLSTGRLRAATAIIAISISALIGTHILVSEETVLYELPSFTPQVFVEIYLAWGVLWIPILCGVCMVPRDVFVRISFTFVVVSIGALTAACFSRGGVRMFTALMPVAVVLCGFFLEEVRRHEKLLLIAFIGVLTLNPLFALPTVFTPREWIVFEELEQFYYRQKVPIIVFHIFANILNVYLLFRLRDVVRDGLANNLRMISKEVPWKNVRWYGSGCTKKDES